MMLHHISRGTISCTVGSFHLGRVFASLRALTTERAHCSQGCEHLQNGWKNLWLSSSPSSQWRWKYESRRCPQLKSDY